MKIKIGDLLHKGYVKNGIWLYLLQAFNTIIPLLTLPYITRILGTAGYGTFSVAFNIISYFQVFVEYGFGMSATREVTLSDKKEGSINKIFSAVLISRFFLFILCIILGLIYVTIYKNEKELYLCFCALFVSLLGYVIQLNWFFQGIQEMKFISITNITARLVTIIPVFTIIRDSSDLISYCLLYASAPVLSGIIGIIVAKKKYKIKLVRLLPEDYLKELKNGWFVFTTQMSSKVFGAIGITFLGIFTTKDEVGIYSAIQKIATLFILGWSPVSQVIYPIVSKKMTEDFFTGVRFVYKVRKYILFIFGLACSICCIFSKFLIKFAYGKEYASKSYWVIPLLLWVLVSINNNFYGIQILLGSGHDKDYSKCFQISVLATVFFNLVLIYLFHGDGACIAPLISESVLGLLLYIKVKSLKKQSVNINVYKNECED